MLYSEPLSIHKERPGLHTCALWEIRPQLALVESSPLLLYCQAQFKLGLAKTVFLRLMLYWSALATAPTETSVWLRYWSALATAPAEASAVAKVAIIINNSHLISSSTSTF